MKLSLFTRSNCSDIRWSWWTVWQHTHTHTHAYIYIDCIDSTFFQVCDREKHSLCFCLQTASFPWRLANCWQQIMWSDPLLFPWRCKDFYMILKWNRRYFSMSERRQKPANQRADSCHMTLMVDWLLIYWVCAEPPSPLHKIMINKKLRCSTEYSLGLSCFCQVVRFWLTPETISPDPSGSSVMETWFTAPVKLLASVLT